MPEDKLLRPERVRLEALAQAINLISAQARSPTMEELFEEAEEIEKWLYKAKDNI